MADDPSTQGALATHELQASGYHFSKTTLTTWTSSKVFLLLIILQVVRMITVNKEQFCDKSDSRDLNSLKVGFKLTWILSVKP